MMTTRPLMTRLLFGIYIYIGIRLSPSSLDNFMRLSTGIFSTDLNARRYSHLQYCTNQGEKWFTVSVGKTTSAVLPRRLTPGGILVKSHFNSVLNDRVNFTLMRQWHTAVVILTRCHNYWRVATVIDVVYCSFALHCFSVCYADDLFSI